MSYVLAGRRDLESHVRCGVLSAECGGLNTRNSGRGALLWAGMAAAAAAEEDVTAAAEGVGAACGWAESVFLDGVDMMKWVTQDQVDYRGSVWSQGSQRKSRILVVNGQVVGVAQCSARERLS